MRFLYLLIFVFCGPFFNAAGTATSACPEKGDWILALETGGDEGAAAIQHQLASKTGKSFHRRKHRTKGVEVEVPRLQQALSVTASPIDRYRLPGSRIIYLKPDYFCARRGPPLS